MLYYYMEKDKAQATRAENELLLGGAHLRLDSEARSQLAILLREPLDWDYFFKTASFHGVVPLVYLSLRGFPEEVPEAALGHLQEKYRGNSLRNLHMTAELVAVLALLESHGIPVIPYKGPALAAFAYGDVSLRQFGDLDIMVRREDVPRARELLCSRGYRWDLAFTAEQETAFLKAGYCQEHHYTLVHEETGIIVELHWEFTSRFFSFPVDFNFLQTHLERRSLAGQEVLNIKPEYLLPLICLHGAYHAWDGLNSVCDVAVLATVEGLDWQEVMAVATSLNSKRGILLGLVLAHNLLGTALPEEIRRQGAADRKVDSLASRVRHKLFLKTEHRNTLPEFLFRFRLRETSKDRFKDLFYSCFAPSAADWELINLPRSVAFLYHTVRPLRLIGKYGLKLRRLQD